MLPRPRQPSGQPIGSPKTVFIRIPQNANPVLCSASGDGDSSETPPTPLLRPQHQHPIASRNISAQSVPGGFLVRDPSSGGISIIRDGTRPVYMAVSNPSVGPNQPVYVINSGCPPETGFRNPSIVVPLGNPQRHGMGGQNTMQHRGLPGARVPPMSVLSSALFQAPAPLNWRPDNVRMPPPITVPVTVSAFPTHSHVVYTTTVSRPSQPAMLLHYVNAKPNQQGNVPVLRDGIVMESANHPIPTTLPSSVSSGGMLVNPTIIKVNRNAPPEVEQPKSQFLQLPGLNFKRIETDDEPASKTRVLKMNAPRREKKMALAGRTSVVPRLTRALFQPETPMKPKLTGTSIQRTPKKPAIKGILKQRKPESNLVTTVPPIQAPAPDKVLTLEVRKPAVPAETQIADKSKVSKPVQKSNSIKTSDDFEANPAVHTPSEFVQPAAKPVRISTIECKAALELLNADPSNPAKRIIFREMTEVLRDLDILNITVYVDFDQSMSSRWVHVFSVIVMSSDGSTVYPPVKLQITDDYPAEEAAFLDFESISASIANERTRAKFNHIVKLFKEELERSDMDMRIPSMMKTWCSNMFRQANAKLICSKMDEIFYTLL